MGENTKSVNIRNGSERQLQPTFCFRCLKCNAICNKIGCYKSEIITPRPLVELDTSIVCMQRPLVFVGNSKNV